MVVQHNMQALNSTRMLGITQGTLSKSAEKLSSGYKVNRAADDAAGLSISEKMRKQIRGLTQASANAEDGISAVQTAEGALTEVHDMLQRMNELAVKAANGTMSEDDRSTIQDEVDQLLTEIDRVAETTKFNETYLLKGDSAGTTTTVTFSAYDAGLEGSWDTGTPSAYSQTDETVSQAKFTVNSANLQAGKTVSIGGQEWTITTGNESETNFVITSGNAISKMSTELLAANKVGDAGNTAAVAVSGTTFTITKGTATTTKALTFGLHVGADADMTNKIAVKIDTMDTKGLGINGLKVMKDGNSSNDSDIEGANATYAIDAIANAVSKVSLTRSKLGAIQNRLEHTTNNLDNIVENTTSAESQIRDTDMADEMVKYSNANILSQAGQSMVAQANQANQGVLSLL